MKKMKQQFFNHWSYFLNIEKLETFKISHPAITKPTPQSCLPAISSKNFSSPHYSYFSKISSPLFMKGIQTMTLCDCPNVKEFPEHYSQFTTIKGSDLLIVILVT